PTELSPLSLHDALPIYLHHRRAAVQCYAYVERIRNLGAGEDISVRTIELKWGGTFIPGIRIAAQGERLLTVLSTIRDAPPLGRLDRKSTRLNSSHDQIS